MGNKNTQMAANSVNVEANALAPLLNSGTINLYTASQPATADTALGAQVLLASPTFGATAFGAAASGVITANAITAATAVATGKATWARLKKSDGTTTVLDESVGMKLTGTDISFTAATKVIAKTSGGFNSTNLSNGDQIVVSGTASNNGTFTVASFTDTSITTNEALVNESAGASMTIQENKNIVLTNVNIGIGVSVSVTSYTHTIATATAGS